MDLFIVRHGNTFGPNDVVRRVGSDTDIPLVEKGLEQATAVGTWLKENGYTPALVVRGPLLRHQQMATGLAEACGYTADIQEIHNLREINYGPDENQPEAAVLERLGSATLTAWDQDAIVPPNWEVDIPAIQQGWQQVANAAQTPCTVAVTSNGTARFANVLTSTAATMPKLKTGAIGHLRGKAGHWDVVNWNFRP